MRQRWHGLLFLHFPCDPLEIQALLPKGLTVDTFPDEAGEEKAWVGLVPFLMQDVRWAFAPAVPGTHTFPETNVRTYVHHDGEGPGVWFFSLDAANSLAVAIARLAFSLPYSFARMRVSREGELVSYSGRRKEASYEIVGEIGEELPSPEPGSLDFFLVERYLLYSARGSQLSTGRVFHPPYPLRIAEIRSVREELVRASGIAPRPFVRALFSDGVDVEVWPLRRLS